MLDHNATIIMIGSRKVALVSQIIGSSITPRFMSQLLIRPIWSPEKRILHTTAIATAPVMLGE